jgi:hypothetical protein
MSPNHHFACLMQSLVRILSQALTSHQMLVTNQTSKLVKPLNAAKSDLIEKQLARWALVVILKAQMRAQNLCHYLDQQHILQPCIAMRLRATHSPLKVRPAVPWL